METANKLSTILCVDDNEIHAYAMVHALEHEGFNHPWLHRSEFSLMFQWQFSLPKFLARVHAREQ